MEDTNGGVLVVSRRMVRPERESSRDGVLSPEHETMHLTPWDLRMLTVEYIQKGVLLPKPPAGGEHVVDGLVSSFARALGRFYPLAGRLTVAAGAETTSPEPASISVSLCCNHQGAEFVHAVAPGVTVADIATSLYIPRVVWSFFPLNGLLGADAAVEDSRALLAVQVTELADGVFVAMSLNHAVVDGTAFWHFVNTWSAISRSKLEDISTSSSSPPPAFERLFLDTCTVPISLPFAKLEHIIQRCEHPPPLLQEFFFHFSSDSIKKLKAKANGEMAGMGAAAAISSLQSLLALLWRSVSRARGLSPCQETMYILLIGCRGRVRGMPPGYVGNAVVPGRTKSTAGEILDKGLGWTAWRLNRAVAEFDEASMRDALASWTREPQFFSAARLRGGTTMVTGSSPRFDMFGNDFGWGRPVAVRSGAGNKFDGKATVYEGRGGGGSMALEVCLSPDAMARLVADEEFMEAVDTEA